MGVLGKGAFLNSSQDSDSGGGGQPIYDIINVASDFPTLAAVVDGGAYAIGTDVTDDDAAKTNTGQSFVEGQIIVWDLSDTKWIISSAGAIATWGQIGGTLSNQTDLQNALDAKQDANSNLTTLTTSTVGDTIYSSATDTLSKLAGNATITKKFLRSVGDGADAAAPSWEVVKAADTSIEVVGSPSCDNAQEAFQVLNSSGSVSGGVLSVNGGDPTTYDISILQGFIRTADSDVLRLPSFSVAASSARPTVTDTTVFVGVEYNAGTPQFVEKASYDWDYNSEFPLGFISNVGGVLHIYSNPWIAGNNIANISKRFLSNGRSRDEFTGGLLVSETGTRNIIVTAGIILDVLNRHPISAIDTSAAGTFDTYYYSGSAWILTQGETQWDNVNYNNIASGLQAISSNNYANIWFYAVGINRIIAVYGQAEYPNTSGAIAEGAPSFLPDGVTQSGILIARLLFRKSEATAVEIDSAFTTTFSSTQATNHNNLSDVQGGIAGEHYHLTASQASSLFSWNETTATSEDLVAANGYVANNAGLVTYTLPATAAFGERFSVVYKGAGGWAIAQNAGQKIIVGNTPTTEGTGGSLASSDAGDVVEFICTTADTIFTVINSRGNLTVV